MPKIKRKQVVITGVGVVSSIGIGKEEFWQNLFEGKSGFRPITLFDTKDLKVKIAGEITDFNPESILGKKGLIDLDRAALLLLSAAKLALDDSQLEVNEDNTGKIGVSVGTTFGSLNSISKFNRESLSEGPRYVNPSIFPSTVGNSPASRISIRFKIKGYNSTLSTGMPAALDAIDYARDSIELNRVDTAICGSVEDLNIQTFLGFYKLNYLSGLKNNSGPISCPFDKRRSGIVSAEGSAVFVLEDYQAAKNTKTNIYGEVLGMGTSFDPARFYKYNPKAEGMKQAMNLALEDAKLKPEDIDCIFANANSTQDADSIETLAIKDVFGSYGKEVPVTAPKSILGETFSASGGLATAAALGALQRGAVPPTINYKEKDELCDLNYVINESLRKNLSKVMINSFGPYGVNTCMIIGK